MGAYILRRLLLIIPTLLGIMIVNFTLVQFVPGGPVEQVLAQMQGGGDVFEGFSGGGNDVAEETFGSDSDYVGARGLPKEFIEELEKEFGFDKPPLERFFNMLWNYMRLDFGESYFRSISVVDLVLEKMPVSITLGLWSTIIAYLVSIPLGIRKAVHDGTSFDTWTSAMIIVAYAIPGFLFAILCCSCCSRVGLTIKSSRLGDSHPRTSKTLACLGKWGTTCGTSLCLCLRPRFPPLRH